MSMRILTLVAVLLASSVHAAAAANFRIQPGKPNLVRFVSKAPLETFEGKTTEVQGQVALDPAALGDSIDAVVEVDLASLDTGLSLRNKHMRENHLETKKFPKAIFRGGKISELSRPNLEAGQKTTFVLAGTFALHGVEKPLNVPIELSPEPVEGSSGLRITARFSVALADFKISRPSFLVMQLQEVQQVIVELVATSAAPGP